MLDAELKAAIDRIGDKLAALRQNVLHKPLSERNLLAIEQRIGGPLPPGYRAFLRHLGNGGVGPYYGVERIEYSLAVAAAMAGDDAFIDPEVGPKPMSLRRTLDRHEHWSAALAEPFPLNDDVEFADEIPGGKLTQKAHSARLKNDQDYVAAWDAVGRKYEDPKWLRGTLRVISFGGGDFFFVVVNGSGPDSVWVDAIDGVTGIYNTGVSFLRFYENWLDSLTGEGRKDRCSYAFLEFGSNPRYGS